MSGGDYRAKCSYEMEDFEKHPTPHSDELLCDHMSKGMYFGFNSIYQLKQWVYKQKWRQELQDEGFEIRVYKALGVHGIQQSIFLKKKMYGKKYKLGIGQI